VLEVAAEPEDAGTLDADCELGPVSAEAVELTADRAWLTSEEGAVLSPEGAPGAVTALGPVAADAGLAVRSDSAMNAAKPTTAIPAAHRQGRRTLVTREAPLLVTSVTIARHYPNS